MALRRRVLQALYPSLHRVRLLGWRLFRPETHGARVLIQRKSDGAILLIRHSYGRRDLWFPPGGGYNPGREAAEDAARRETQEEVGLHLPDLIELGVYRSDAAGNRDTIRLFLGTADSADPVPSAEIEDVRWFLPGDLPPAELQAKVTRTAIRLLDGL